MFRHIFFLWICSSVLGVLLATSVERVWLQAHGLLQHDLGRPKVSSSGSINTPLPRPTGGHVETGDANGAFATGAPTGTRPWSQIITTLGHVIFCFPAQFGLAMTTSVSRGSESHTNTRDDG